MLVKPAYYGQYTPGMGLLVLRHDDYYWTVWHPNALPIYEAAGITGTFYSLGYMFDLNYSGSSPGWSAGKTALNRIYALDMHQKGFEVASHSFEHLHLKTETESVVRTQLETNIAVIKELLGDDCRIETFTCPFNETDATVNAIVDDYHTCNSPNSDPSVAIPPSDYYDLPSQAVLKDTAVSVLTAVVDDVDANGKYGCIMLHQIEHWTESDGSNLPVADYGYWDKDLQILVDHILTKSNTLVVQARDAVRYMQGLGDYNFTATAVLALGDGDVITAPTTLNIEAQTALGEDLYTPSITVAYASASSHITIDSSTGVMTPVADGTAQITATVDGVESNAVGVVAASTGKILTDIETVETLVYSAYSNKVFSSDGIDYYRGVADGDAVSVPAIGLTSY